MSSAVPLERHRLAVQLGAARVAQAAWTAVPVAERARVIHRAMRVITCDAERFVGLLADSGRPRVEAWAAEVLPTLDALRWLASRGAAALRPQRLRARGLQWYLRATRHTLSFEPYGVIGIVTPANAPLFLGVPQVAGAVLGGNAVLWKPAPAGDDVARLAVDALRRGGVPRALVQQVTGDGSAARAVVDAGVDKLHFTGGSDAGLALYAAQAARGRSAVLELSGRHAAIVLADADVTATAAGLTWAKRANAGRNCITPQLVLAERAAAPALEGALAAQWPQDAGDGIDGARLGALVHDACAQGARLVAGAPGGPALVAGVRRGMRVVEEEVGGPVLALAAVDSAEHAIAWVNGSTHRLSASLWARDVTRARRLAARLDVSLVTINDALHAAGHPEVPLAGRGASGFGATRGLPGLMELVQPRVVSETPPRASRRHWSAAPGAERVFAWTAALASAWWRRS